METIETTRNRHDGLLLRGCRKLLHGPTLGAMLLVFSLAANAAPRDPIFSVPSGTTFSSVRMVAISVPHNGQTKFTRDQTNPSLTNGEVYTKPITISESTTLKAVAIVDSTLSNVVTASYVLNSQKFPPVSSGGTSPPAIILQRPVIGQ